MTAGECNERHENATNFIDSQGCLRQDFFPEDQVPFGSELSQCGATRVHAVRTTMI